MNRRDFLRASGAAAAVGLVAKAEALDFLARQPTSIIKPTSFTYRLERFNTISFHPLAKTGDASKWLMMWKRNQMLPGSEQTEGYVAQKVVTVSGHMLNYRQGAVDEYAYQCMLRGKELISDVAFEEGWFDEYRAAGRPLPSKFGELPFEQMFEVLTPKIYVGRPGFGIFDPRAGTEAMTNG